MDMSETSIKEHWYWKISRAAIWVMVAGVVIFQCVLFVTLFTKDITRVSLQDGSPQACFLKSN